MKNALFLFALLMSLSLPAYAYKTALPSVEVDLSVLEEPAPEAVTATPLLMPPPAEKTLPPLGKGRILKPKPAPIPATPAPEAVAEEDLEEEHLPLPPAEKPKKLLKPFFATAPLPPENLPPEKAEAPVKTPPKPVFPKRALVKTPPPAKKPVVPVETEAEMISVPLIAEPPPPPAPLPEEEAPEKETREAEAKEEIAPPAPAKNIVLTLSFNPAQGDLSPEHQAQLSALIPKLAENEAARLQIRAYATDEDGSPSNARRMSLSRALMVRSYLMDKGVKPVRLDVRALGSETTTTPLNRVDLVLVE